MSIRRPSSGRAPERMERELSFSHSAAAVLNLPLASCKADIHGRKYEKFIASAKGPLDAPAENFLTVESCTTYYPTKTVDPGIAASDY